MPRSMHLFMAFPVETGIVLPYVLVGLTSRQIGETRSFAYLTIQDFELASKRKNRQKSSSLPVAQMLTSCLEQRVRKVIFPNQINKARFSLFAQGRCVNGKM